jgi:glycerol-3-phosphate dehydrogenase
LDLPSLIRTEVLIVGGGATGTALARDLALRGVDCVLVEKSDVNAGASGRNHGLLHSGARYVASDRDAAIECRAEGAVLKRIAPQAIQDTGGYFVAVPGDDERYIADFPSFCERSGIAVRAVDVATARAHEPALSDRAIAVYEVPDASIDPFRLSLETIAHAQRLGARLLRHARVVDFEREGRRIRGARVRLETGPHHVRIEAAQYVNAAGAWARDVAALAGAPIAMTYAKGTLLITHSRLAERVVNRLRRPGNADIVMPGGTVSIVGTTSTSVDDPEEVTPGTAEADLIVDEAARMVPALQSMRFVRAYAGVRPLVGVAASGDARSVSRGFALLDHEAQGLDNFATITGGKLTTCRLMAERAADLVCRRLGVTRPCLTAVTPLPVAPECAWTEPGHAPHAWLRSVPLEDPLLCECEMVSATAVDAIYAALRSGGDPPTLAEIGLRSRVGKGACQGSFCSIRTAVHLCQRDDFPAARGLADVVDFVVERWRSQRAVLWGEQLAQAELTEALHCGLFGEELVRADAAAPTPGSREILQ